MADVPYPYPSTPTEFLEWLHLKRTSFHWNPDAPIHLWVESTGAAFPPFSNTEMAG